MDTCICMTESLCCPSETITTLLIGDTPIQNIKFLKKQLKKQKRAILSFGEAPPHKKDCPIKQLVEKGLCIDTQPAGCLYLGPLWQGSPTSGI